MVCWPKAVEYGEDAGAGEERFDAHARTLRWVLEEARTRERLLSCGGFEQSLFDTLRNAAKRAFRNLLFLQSGWRIPNRLRFI